MNWKRVIRALGLMGSVVPVILGLATVGYSMEENTVTVFAAASTTNAVTEIGELFVRRGTGRFLPSFASSSTLAKQIENGAPASVYISANRKWMDYLEDEGLIDSGSRHDLLGNRIVLIAPAESPLDNVDIKQNFGMEELLDGGYLAMGDPDHVPAGLYGKQALETLGIWEHVRDRIARQKDVRSALALVERGEVSLGVVYATDAAITDKVKVVGIFPESSHPPIVYPVALVNGNRTSAAKEFLGFLQSDDARAVFEKYGFIIP